MWQIVYIIRWKYTTGLSNIQLSLLHIPHASNVMNLQPSQRANWLTVANQSQPVGTAACIFPRYYVKDEYVVMVSPQVQCEYVEVELLVNTFPLDFPTSLCF